jgi:pyrroloquinoline quinone (PQQ) biosynthesis protein C
MIAEALRYEIEKYSHEAKKSAMYQRALAGSLGRQDVARYLCNVLHLLQHTPVYLARAHARASERGDIQLAAFFQQKLGEEVGHDQWAVQDLANFRAHLNVDAQDGVVPSLDALLTYLARTIDEDPTLYLAYILFAEYFTVLEAPEWLALLEERCGIPKEFMSAVGNHAELDKDHVAEGLDAIDALVTDPAYLVPMRRALHESITHFDRFLAEVAN